MTKTVANTDPMEPNTVGKPGKERPANKPGIDIPAEPGQPTPERTHPDHPGGPPEPVDPGKTPGL